MAITTRDHCSPARLMLAFKLLRLEELSLITYADLSLSLIVLM